MKRIFLFFLAFGLLFSLLTACGESKDSEDTDTPISAAQESGPAVSSEPDQPGETENSSETAVPSEPDLPAESEAGDSGDAEAGDYTFIGTAAEVLDREIMIEVTEGDIQNYGDNVLVSFPDEIELNVQPGDTVRITFDGIVMPSLPPRVSASAYEILESAG
ncbi:MAG: hypothetical protein LUC17_03250 [Oscillospiraceae bacterium]|nr:hypothetical protein [Oscillospiraceae bacterium]